MTPGSAFPIHPRKTWLACRAAAWLGLALSSFSARGAAPEKWLVPGAEMRFKMEIESHPTAAEAGVIAMLPNGGALPQPYPEAVVVDSDGKVIPNFCIWNNPDEGFAIVFPEPSASGPVSVYLASSPSPANVWTPAAPLHPSLLLYTETGRADLGAAKALGGEGVPGRGTRMGQVPMIADRSNRFGAGQTFISYYTGWLNVPEDGDIYFATISSDGSTAEVDGKTVADWPGLHSPQEGRTGNKGRSITLTKGPHRVQYFQFSESGTPLSQLIWRLPSQKEPLPKTPKGGDFTRSGMAWIISAESKSGVPPALFDKKAVSYMNFADQFVDLFELSVPASPQYKNASITWQFSDGYVARGPRVLWPVLRGAPPQVTLTVSLGNARSMSTRLLYPDKLPEGAKVDDLEARRDYCEALLNRLKGAPNQQEAAQGWPPSFWEMLPQIVRGGEAQDLIAYLFQHAGAALSNLASDERNRLSDIYYDEFKGDHATALATIDSLLAATKDPAIRFRWQLDKADLQLYELGDVAGARQTAATLQVDPFHSGHADAELKLIAMGDVEQMAGKIDLATQYYTAAQAMNQKASRPAFNAFAGFSDPMAQRTPAPSGNGMVIQAAETQDADWRKRTVVQNSYYTEVKNLLDQDELSDAKEKLSSWALEFPLAKLAGDYALAEADYAMKFDDFDRAARVLRAYRKHVDLSPELAEAMGLEWECEAELQRPEEIKDLAADIKKRFPDLPIAKPAELALHGQMPQAVVGRKWLGPKP